MRKPEGVTSYLIIAFTSVAILGLLIPGIAPVQAAEAPSSLSVSSATGDKGDTVTIYVNLNDGSGVMAFGFDLTFDSSVLTYIDTGKGGLVPGGWNFNSNVIGGSTVRVGGYSGDGTTPLNSGGGSLAAVQFQIKSTAAYGSTVLTSCNPTDDISGVSCGSGTITIAPGVKIVFFTATPGTVGQGESSTLSWDIDNATSANINNGVGNVNPDTGSKQVSPTQTTTYTLTATGATGSKTQNVTVTVSKVNKPVIKNFTASPSTIVKGQSAKLSWEITGAKNANINNGVGAVNKTSGEKSVSPKNTTTYTLTATNAGGSTTATTTVSVINEPVINFFASSNPDNDPIHTSEKAYLSWDVFGAERVEINKGVGKVDSEGGTTNVNPNNTTKYTLTAYNAAGSSSEETTVAVTDKPRIRNFSAQPFAIIKGQATNFLWTTAGATTLDISPGVGPVSGGNGTIGYFATESGKFTLAVSNGSGSDSASVEVDVYHDPPELELTLSKVGAAKKSVRAPSSGRRLGKADVGTETIIECKLANIGTGDAKRFKVQLKENGEVIDEISFKKLDAGDSTTLSFSYMPLKAGNNLLEIVADPEYAVPEYDEANNIISGVFVGDPVKGTDLVISHVRVYQPGIVAPASVLIVSFRITNCGTTDATAFNYKAYLARRSNRITAKDTLAVEGQISELKGDGDYVEVTKTVILKKIKKKFHFLGYVDHHNAVTEANENNNTTVKQIRRDDL